MASTRASSPDDSTLIGLDPEAHGGFELRERLPTPVNTMSPGSNPARRATSISHTELASAALPNPRSRRGNRERGIRFQRIVDGVRIRREGLIELLVALADRRRAIDVDGGADRLGDGAE